MHHCGQVAECRNSEKRATRSSFATGTDLMLFSGLRGCINSCARIRSSEVGTALAVEGAPQLGSEVLELLRVQAQAEGQRHLAQDRLDLVQRLLAEVLGHQELGL